MGTRRHLLGGEEPQEQSETGDDEAEAHDRETGASPRQEGALGGEEHARVRHVQTLETLVAALRQVMVLLAA